MPFTTKTSMQHILSQLQGGGPKKGLSSLHPVIDAGRLLEGSLSTVDNPLIQSSRKMLILALDTIAEKLSYNASLSEGSSLIVGVIVLLALHLKNENPEATTSYDTNHLLSRLLLAIGGESSEQFGLQLNKGFFKKDITQCAHFLHAAQDELVQKGQAEQLKAIEHYLSILPSSIKPSKQQVSTAPVPQNIRAAMKPSPTDFSILHEAGHVAADIKKVINAFGRKGTHRDLFNEHTHDLEKARLGYWILQIDQIVKAGVAENPEWLSSALQLLGLDTLEAFAKQRSEEGFVNEVSEFNKLFSAQRGYHVFIAKILSDQSSVLNAEQQMLLANTLNTLNFIPPNASSEFRIAYESGKYDADVADCQRFMRRWLMHKEIDPIVPEVAPRIHALKQLAEMICATPPGPRRGGMHEPN